MLLSLKFSSGDDFYVIGCDLSIQIIFFIGWFFIECNILMNLKVVKKVYKCRGTAIIVIPHPERPSDLLVVDMMFHTAPYTFRRLRDAQVHFEILRCHEDVVQMSGNMSQTRGIHRHSLA